MMPIVATAPAWVQDTVFSGPQPGEKLPPFKVLKVVAVSAPQEVELLRTTDKPVVLVFWHGVERSMLPLVRVVDQYASEQKEKLALEHVILYGDRLEGEKRIPLVQQSLRLGSAPYLSPEGLEGPGSYGLNKKCLLTILVGKAGKTVANFALVQPGIADAPKVLKAIAEALGDTNPPTASELEARAMAARNGAAPRRPAATAPDLTTEQGLREAVIALQAEVAALKKELAELKGTQRGQPAPPAGPIPGAAPTDPMLLGLLRAFIQPSNSESRVDDVLKEVKDYIKGKPELEKQARDGWVRVLHLKYGTAYAQTAGQKFVESLGR